MPGPWEQYQTQPATEEAPATEAPPTEAAQPTAPVEAEEGPWTRYATPAPVETKKVEPPVAEDAGKKWAEEHPVAGRALAALTGVADVVPFRKDIQAGIHAITDFGEGTYGEKFSRAKAAQTRAQKALSEAYPMSHLAGQVAPLLAAPELALTAPETAVATKLAPYLGGMGSKIATGAASGAGLGALYGAGEGESLEERAKNIKSGAGFGLIGGAAAPILGAGAKKVFEKAKDFGPYIGIGTEGAAGRKTKEAWDLLTESARKGKTGMTAADVAESERYGQPVYPIDVLGAPGIAAAKKASALSPEAKGIIESELSERNRNQQDMFRRFVSEHVMNKPNIDIFSDAGRARIKSEADEYVPDSYQIAFGNPANRDVMSEGLENALQYSAVQKVIPKAVQSLNDERVRSGLPKLANPFEQRSDLGGEFGVKDGYAVPLELWDKIKRQVQARANKYKPTPLSLGNPELHREISGQAHDITKALKDLDLPGYNEALEGAAKYKGEQSAWGMGAKFATITDRQKINSIIPAISKLSQEEKEHFAHAYLQNMADKILGAFQNRNIGSMLKEQQKEKNIAALGPERAAMIHDYLKRADIANKSLSGLGGSDTANKIMELVKMAGGPSITGAILGGAGDIATEYASGHGDFNPERIIKNALMGAATGYALGRVKTSGMKVSEEFANQLAKKLVSNDPDAVAEAMGQINKSPQLRQAMSKAEVIMQQLAASRGAREERASGGKVGKRDYPAKRLNKMERAARRAQRDIALETTPLMQQPDEQIAQALRIAKGES